MELWIRSQDKNNLIKVYDMWIDDTDMVENGYVSIMANSDFSFELGTYKSKKRALEVLDEIQNMLIKNRPSVLTYTDGNIVNIDGNLVFEMPER